MLNILKLRNDNLVGYLHHGEAQHLVAQHEALLEHLDHGVFSGFLVLHMHDGVVLFRVKGLTLGLDLRDAQLGPRLAELAEDQLQTLTVDIRLVILGDAPLPVCLLYTSRCV